MRNLEKRDKYGDINEKNLENIIRKKLEIDGYSEQKVFEWAEDNDLIDILKNTDFFYNISWDNPYLNRHTLEHFIWEDGDGDWFYEDLYNNFYEQYEINMDSISSVPYWIDSYEGERFVAEHITGYAGYEVGDIIDKEQLPQRYGYEDIVQYEKYELVDAFNQLFEVEFVPDYGQPVYYPINDSCVLIWRGFNTDETNDDEDDDESSESESTHWEF